MNALVLFAGVHAGTLAAFPSAPLLAVGLWWNANTVSHNFIHRPFFRSRAANGLFSAFLSLLLGFPQSVWRERHLAHHGESDPQPLRRAVETGLVAAEWTALLLLLPAFFLAVWLPGFLAGMGLCLLHGHYEHARGTVSHYGRLYNFLFLNDGYHVEHHLDPRRSWSRLRRVPGAPESRWPAVLRWLDAFSLDGLERWALRVPALQRFLVESHERAFRRILGRLPRRVRRVGIVGGGLFPRTALVLRRLLPAAELVVIDASRENIERARRIAGEGVQFVHRVFEPGEPADFDLVVIPLAFIGDREAVYRRLRGPVVVHDWIWRPRGVGTVVSAALFKRLNLVMP